jgi:SAM-dependent methyltransferase
MKRIDKESYIDRYTKRLEQFGYSPQTLGWGQHGRQEIRFGVLGEPIIKQAESSVLDVGCGFADFYDYLVERGWQGTYHGVDLVPGLLEIAKQRHPTLDIKEMDILNYPLDEANKCDFVVASGVFNAILQEEDNKAHIERSITHMFHLAKAAVCVDFLSTFVDFQNPIAWHTDPAWAMELAGKLSKRFLIRHDYMPFEFSLIIYCDDSRSQRNVFNAAEKALVQSDKQESNANEGE